MANIHDVARKAGVSKSTVSLVLNNSPLIKPETAKLVMDAVEALQYVPNSNARCLSNRTMNSLGIIILTEDHITHEYSFGQLAGLCTYNIADGIYMGLSETDYSIATEYFCVANEPRALPKIVQNRRVDGIFVVGSFFDGSVIERIDQSGIPTFAVGIGRRVGIANAVLADPEEGSYIGVKRLLETDHQRICYLNCPSIFLSAEDRKNGALRAACEGGYRFAPGWFLYSGKNNGQSGYEIFRDFWLSGARPDGIVAANAPLALGAVRYLTEIGVKIPEDISIVVYEDSLLCGYSTPALSAINIRKEKMGQIAAGLMLERLANPDTASRILTVDPYLVNRDSVAQR